MKAKHGILTGLAVLFVVYALSAFAQAPEKTFGPVSYDGSFTIYEDHNNGNAHGYFPPPLSSFGDFYNQLYVYGFLEWSFTQGMLPPEAAATITKVQLKFKVYHSGAFTYPPPDGQYPHTSFSMYDVKLQHGTPADQMYAAVHNDVQNKILDGTTTTNASGAEEFDTGELTSGPLLQAVRNALTSGRNYLMLGFKRIPEQGNGDDSWDLVQTGHEHQASLEVRFTAPQYNVQFKNDLGGVSYGTISFNGNQTNSGASWPFYWGDQVTVAAYTGRYQYASNHWKYRTWDQNNFNDNQNPKSFTIIQSRDITAWFNSVYDVTVKNDFDGLEAGYLLYGGNQVATGYAELDVFNGLARTFGAISPQSYGGTTWGFYEWDDHINTPGRNEYITSTRTFRAKFKGQQRSSISTASGTNSQRKVAMRGDVAHAVYASGGIIWYSRYADETWSDEIPLSLTNTISANPCVLAMHYQLDDLVYVVWEEPWPSDPTRSRVLCRISVNDGLSWLGVTEIDGEAASPSTPIVGGPFNPVIVWKDFGGPLKVRLDPYRTWHWYTVLNTDPTCREFSIGQTASFDSMFCYVSYVKGAPADGDVWMTRFQLTADSVTYLPVIVPESWKWYCLSCGYPWMTECRATSATASWSGDQIWVGWDAKGMGDMDPQEWTGIERRVFIKGRQGWHWLPLSYLEYTRYSMSPSLGIDSNFYSGTSKLNVLWQDYYNNAVEYTQGTYGFNVLAPGRAPGRVDFTFNQQPWRMWTGLTGPPYAITLDQPLGPIYEGALTEHTIPTRVARVGCVQLDSISFGSLGRGAVSGELMIRLGNLTLKRGSVSTPIEFSTYDGIFEDWLGSNRFTVPLEGDSLLLHVGLDVRGFVINDSRLPLTTPVLATMISDSSGPVSSKVLRINDLVHGNKLDTICYFRLAFPLSALRGKQIRLKQRLIGQAEGYSPAWAEWIRAVAIDSGSSGSEGDPVLRVEETGVPMELALHAAYPNPFNPSTELRFDLPEPATVSLIIYDLLGRKVAAMANGNHEAGSHSVNWNASDMASGVYLARFSVVNGLGNTVYTKTNKLVLMK